MLHIVQNGNIAIIDVRERIIRGEHPRGEIMHFVRQAKRGTVIEVHLPHRAEPLIAAISSMGMNVIVNEIEPGHFRLMAVKF